MTDPETIEQRLRDCATDWNGEQMPDNEPAKGDPTAGTLREAADLIASLRAEREVLREVFAHLDKASGDAPGHGHKIPGIWDNDISNGENAGLPCEWCAKWSRARAALAAGEGGR